MSSFQESTLDWLQSLPTSALTQVLSKMPREKQVSVLADLKSRKPPAALIKGRKSRREASNKANKKRTELEQTVQVPQLTDEQRLRRQWLENNPEQWVWEVCGPSSGVDKPLTYEFVFQQQEMIRVYDETLRHGGDELILASRGEGKTTYFRLMVLKTVADGTVDFAALINATSDDAKNSKEAIQDIVLNSRSFAELYPEIAVPVKAVGATPQLAKGMRASGVRMDNGERFEGAQIAFTWSERGLVMPSVPGSPSGRSIIQFRGADRSIRGLNVYGRRPRIVAMDDLDTPETVSGDPKNAKKVIDRVDLDIGGLKGQKGAFSRIMLATLPKQACGVAHHYATQGYPFTVRRFRYLVERPQRWDLWMEYVKIRQRAKKNGDTHAREAHRFYLANKGDMQAGAKVSNPHRFNDTKLPDGSQAQLDALQNYFDEWADKGEFFCRCELDNELIEQPTQIISTVEMGNVSDCEGDWSRRVVDEATNMIVAGIDVRKIELHHAIIASDESRLHRIPEYDVTTHGTSETTVQQAEKAIREGLKRLAKQFEDTPIVDQNGTPRRIDLVLIDKGWMGSWTEDGERKTWVNQPVDLFCQKMGFRRWLPAKGAPNYRSPKPYRSTVIGDNWHINFGTGRNRQSTELIWNAEHWHSLVEELFMTEDDTQRFVLFDSKTSRESHHANHDRLAQHICEGAADLAELRRTATRTKKPKYRRDHWWDSIAMALVARSVEFHFREREANRKPRRSLAEMARKANG